MAARYNEIDKWFDDGKEAGAEYMVVVTDTFDYEDHPVYCSSKLDVVRVQMKVDETRYEQVQEIYNLKMDKGTQMAQVRAWNI